MAEGDADLLFLLAATLVVAVVVAGCMKASVCVCLLSLLACCACRCARSSIVTGTALIASDLTSHSSNHLQSSDDDGRGSGGRAAGGAAAGRGAQGLAASGAAAAAAAKAAKARMPARPLSARARALQRELALPFGAAVTFTTHHVRTDTHSVLCLVLCVGRVCMCVIRASALWFGWSVDVAAHRCP
jgi:hypothetical protein